MIAASQVPLDAFYFSGITLDEIAKDRSLYSLTQSWSTLHEDVIKVVAY